MLLVHISSNMALYLPNGFHWLKFNSAVFLDSKDSVEIF